MCATVHTNDLRLEHTQLEDLYLCMSMLFLLRTKLLDAVCWGAYMNYRTMLLKSIVRNTWSKQNSLDCYTCDIPKKNSKFPYSTMSGHGDY